MKRLIFFFALISSQAFGQIRNAGNVLSSLIADTTIDLYLEADRGILNKAGSAAFVGDSVATWIDQSKSGKNATQNTSPRYPTVVTSSYNGRQALFFAANGWLTNTSWTGMAHKSAQMSIVALRFVGQDNGPIFEGGANGNGFPVSHASTKTIYAGSYNYSLATYNGRYTEGLLLGVLWNSTNGSTNADRLKIFINGVEDTFSTHSGTVPFSSGIQTAGYNIGGASYTSEKINAEVFAVIHLRRAPTKAQLDSIFSYLREKYFTVPATKVRITAEGNSIVEGYPNQLTPDQGSAWPAILAKTLDSANYISPSGTYLWTYNPLKKYTVRNVGARGEIISTMNGQAASQIDGKRDEMGEMNVVVFAAGTNDISAAAIGGSQLSALATYTAYATYCSNRRLNGAKVIATTILDRRDQGVYQSTFNSKRDSVNTYIRANWRNFADALADVDADPRLDDASDAVHYYTGDQVHLEDTGCIVYAAVVRNAIYGITSVADSAFDNPMTTAGDLIVGGTLGVPTRLGVGTNGQVLTTDGTSVTWGTAGSGYTNLNQFVSQTAHRLFYSDGSGDVQELAFGSSGQYLKANGTTSAPSWDTPAGYTNLTSFTSQTAHRLFYSDGSGDVQELSFGTSGQYLKSQGASSVPTWDTPSGGGGSPAGNFGNLQINRNGAFATPGSDSLDYENSTGLKSLAGFTAPGAGSGSERFGAGAVAAGANGVAVGNGASAGGTNSAALGQNASAAGASSFALGSASSASQSSATAIGVSATASGVNSTSIGSSSTASGTYALAIGQSTSAGHTGSIAIGQSSATTATGQLIIGSDPAPITNVFFNKGVTNASATGVTINGTGGSGTNNAGGTITIAGGKGTGNAAGGAINFQTSDAGSSGTTLQSLTTKASISAGGAFELYNGTAPSASVTNGVQLYSEDVTASAELKVRDEAGNITTLSPHNFGRIPGGKSEPLAWSYNSQRNGQYIAADMALALRTIEQLTQRVAELEALVKGKKGKTVKIIHTGKTK